jgi:DNA-binding transcriptional LysR family regulator
VTAEDLAVMDVRLLRLFAAGFTTNSISKAAEQLGLSQPTVSIGLGRLRAVCVELFQNPSATAVP